MSIISAARIILIGICITALPACGFHLRGSGATALDISAERIFINEVDARDVGREIRFQLRESGVNIESAPGDAQYRILVANERVDRDVLSVSPQTGKVEEYQLTLSVTVSISKAGTEKPLSEERISLVRDYTFDQDAAFAKFQEEETLREELSREAAEQTLRRLDAVIRRERALGE